VVQTLSARRGSVRASVGFVERNYLYRDVTLRIVRRGRTVANRPIEKFGCRACFESRPFELTIRDLDGGEPEVLVDLYTGGAHCCSITLILRYDRGRYRATLGYWGNFGSELVDLDGDRRPEFAAYDERFVYTFAAYVFSAAPVQIWDYRQGKLVDVTRRFPKLVRADAASHWKRYLSERGEKETDVRSVVAAYVADQYLLGNPSEAKRALDLALKRGDLGRGKTLLGWPAGTAFVAELTKDLRKWRYRR
jgi:hypothetical protein